MESVNHWLDPKTNCYKENYPLTYRLTNLTGRKIMARLLPGLLAAPRQCLRGKSATEAWATFISIVPRKELLLSLRAERAGKS